jgi:hypothetical protein
VLLIEQFATVALGLANHAYVMEGGRLRFSGLASELREKPELLRSAYLLRGSNGAPAAAGHATLTPTVTDQPLGPDGRVDPAEPPGPDGQAEPAEPPGSAEPPGPDGRIDPAEPAGPGPG